MQQDDEIDQELEQDSDEDISSVSLFSLIMNDISESDDEETDNVEETDEWQNSPHNVPVVPESLPEEILQAAPEEHPDSTKPISFLTKHDIYKQVMMDAADDLKDTGKSADEIDDIMSGLDGFLIFMMVKIDGLVLKIDFFVIVYHDGQTRKTI